MHTNTVAFNIVAWVTAVAMIALTFVLVGQGIYQWVQGSAGMSLEIRRWKLENGKKRAGKGSNTEDAEEEHRGHREENPGAQRGIAVPQR